MKWLDKYQNKILIAIWGFIFLTILVVIFTEPVHAESPSGSLPYVVSSNWDANSGLHNNFDIALNWARQRYENIDHVPEGYSIMVYTINGCWVDGYGRAWTSYCFIVNPYITDYYSSNFDYTVNTVALRSDYPLYTYNYVNAGVYNSGTGSSPANLLGNYSVVGTEYALYTPYYPFFYDGEPILDPNGVEVIVNTYSPPIDDSGHAVPPYDENGHYIDDGNGNRLTKPIKPITSHYSPSSPSFPTIDSSSLESLIESLIDVTEYGFNYIGGLISGSVSNLLSNISDWVDYIVQSIYFSVNNIVGSIKDLAETFYQNMASLFENVATFFNTLVSLGLEDGTFSFTKFLTTLLVPDSEEFAQSLLDSDIHHFVPLIKSIRIKFLDLYANIFGVTPTKVFVLPSFTMFGKTFNLSFDFSWYDDYKVYGDTIISGFLIIGYIYWFVLQINSMFRGGSSIGDDVTYADKKGERHWYSSLF